MKTKSVLLMWGLLMPFVAMAQYDDDDLYFVPSKKQTRQVSVITTTVPSETTVTTYVPSSYSGSTRDVDEYNRRGRYRRSAAGDGSEASGVDSLATAYTAGYAQGYGDAYSRGYTDATYDIPSYRVRFFNCYDPFWYDSWLWSPYWYDPWYYSGWSYSWGWGWSYYRPWYYGPGWYGGYSYGWGRPYYSWRSPYYYGGRYDYWRRPGEGRPLYNGRTYSGNRHSNVVTGLQQRPFLRRWRHLQRWRPSFRRQLSSLRRRWQLLPSQPGQRYDGRRLARRRLRRWRTLYGWRRWPFHGQRPLRC